MRVYFQGKKGDAVFRADDVEEGNTGLHLYINTSGERRKIAYIPFNRLYFVGPDEIDRESLILSG
jgi:hypothetical protein